LEEKKEEEELPEEETEATEETGAAEEEEGLEKEAEVAEEEEGIGEEVAEEEAFEEEKIEEEAPPRRKEEEEEFVEERIYTIPLRRAWIMPPNKRAPKTIRLIRAFVQRHMKVGETTVEEEGEEKEGGRIIISNEVNEKIWSQGIEKPPRKLRIRAAKDEEGNVTVFLA
jgi:large subunit ribosomal protein L31e